MEFSFLYSLVFAGIIQGIFSSIFILSFKRKRSKASIYLGLLILCITLTNLQYTLDELDIISWDLFNLIYIPYLFLLAPLLYFFIVYFLYPERKIKKVEFLLYLPLVLFSGITIVYKVVALATGRTANYDADQAEIANLIDVYGDFVNIPTLLFTILLLFIHIKNYQKINNTSRSKVIITDLLWIKVLLGVLALSCIPWSVYTYKYWKNEETIYLPIFIITSIVIYIIGYIGIHKIKTLNQRQKIRTFVNKSKPYSIVQNSKNEHIIKLEEIIINDKRYLDPNLSLDFLAEKLQLSKSYLSRIINNELQTSFNDYINSLRIAEAKELLHNPEFSNYTLVAIGLEAGFSSKTTFNNAFKKFTGVTPSYFRKNL
ncbi:AraC family transcriptional regulator [Dokdonia sp.]|uniref:helix-turn-helix domain-containing protein n=1 Tax=Dokdonia sp. TaxID=2024995 RepID=UPI003266DC86